MYYGQFNDSYPPQTDGVAQTMLNYAVWLNRMPDTQCCVVTPQHTLADDKYDFPVIRFISLPLPTVKEYTLGLPEIAFRTTIKLDSLPLKLVHAHCPFASGTLALMTARKKNIPMVATFHTKFADDFAQRLRMENAGKIAAKYTATFFSQADEVWAVNSSSARTLADYGYRGAVTVMPNGCDFAPMERTPEIRQKVLQHFSMDNKPLLLFVGRVVEQKNIGFLLKSFSQIKEVDCNLLLVGDGESFPHYRKVAAELGIANRVKFAGIVRDRDLLRNIYASADIFVLPSVYDNAPLVVREAASCGCPSALIAGSDAAEGIIDGENGFTAALDTVAYARMLENVLKNPDKIKAAGEEARRTVYMSWESVVHRAAGEYKRIISTYNDKQTNALCKRRYYSIPVTIAQELFDKQAMRVKFTTKRVNRLAKHRLSVMQKATIKRIKEMRTSLLENIRKRGL